MIIQQLYKRPKDINLKFLISSVFLFLIAVYGRNKFRIAEIHDVITIEKALFKKIKIIIQ